MLNSLRPWHTGSVSIPLHEDIVVTKCRPMIYKQLIMYVCLFSVSSWMKFSVDPARTACVNSFRSICKARNNLATPSIFVREQNRSTIRGLDMMDQIKRMTTAFLL